MKKIITIVLLSCITIGAFAQTATIIPNPFPKTISVTGSSAIEITPDEIFVVVTLKEYEKKGTGKINIEKIKADFLNACKSVGLADSLITISSYEGSNPQSWVSKKKKEELYASISYQIKFSTSKKIDELVSKLDDEATLNFEVARVSHSQILEYRKQAKIQAIKAAKEKAGYLTEAVGESLGGAVTITEQTSDVFIPMYENNRMAMMNTMSAVSSSSDVGGPDFKKIKITMEINVVFAIK